MERRFSRNVAAGALVLCCGVAGGLALLRPAPEVRFEGGLSQLQPDAALAQLRAAQGSMAFHDNLELLYGQLLLADGDLDGARQSALRLLSRSPESVAALDMLAEIEQTDGDLPRAVLALRRAYRAEPSAERRLRLGGWYAALRMEDAERGLLTSVAPAVLTLPEIDRLLLLLIDAGHLSEYEALLAGVAEGQGPDHLAFKRRWLQYLVERGRTDEAVAAGARWIKGPDAAAVQQASIEALTGRGAIDAAIRLARVGFAEAPVDGHVALPVFARSGHGGVARLLQAEWLAGRQKLGAADWGTLIALAGSTGDLRGLQEALVSGKGLAGPELTAEALMQFLRYRGPVALRPYHALLNPEVVEAAPLLGAAWSMWRGDRAGGYHALLAAARQPLSDWDQLIWMSLSDGLRGTPFHQQLLAGAVDHPGLRQRLRDGVIPPRPLDAAAAEPGPRPG